MLELQQGRGITYFRGRPLHRIAHPSREVGVLLGDVPGHPARTVRGQLRMLCAAAGVPVRRADEVLEAVGLVSLRDERLGTLSRGMDRRLGLACALLPEPHTLVLDDPADGLSTRESHWLHGMLRAHADRGGSVLFTTSEPKEAARAADHVITLDQGRLVADQEATEFARTRLRPRVAVRTPHAARLAALLAKEARTAHRSVEVVREGGNRLSVYGSTCADVGETAFRHGVLVHQLADEIGDMGPGVGLFPGEAAEAAEPPRAGVTGSETGEFLGDGAPGVAASEMPGGPGAHDDFAQSGSHMHGAQVVPADPKADADRAPGSSRDTHSGPAEESDHAALSPTAAPRAPGPPAPPPPPPPPPPPSPPPPPPAPRPPGPPPPPRPRSAPPPPPCPPCPTGGPARRGSAPGPPPAPPSSSRPPSPPYCWHGSVTLRRRGCWPHGRGSCRCRPRRSGRGRSARARSGTRSATPPSPRTAAPAPPPRG